MDTNLPLAAPFQGNTNSVPKGKAVIRTKRVRAVGAARGRLGLSSALALERGSLSYVL